MKANPNKVKRYLWLALYGKNRRIRKKNVKRYLACFEVRMVPYEIAEGVTLYKQEYILKGR